MDGTGVDRDPLRVRRDRRDRHGRGLRGLLVPTELPLARTRAERFDDLVLDAVEELEHRWARELSGVQFAVEPVPPASPDTEYGDELVPLGAVQPAHGTTPARVVLYRRPIEARAADPVVLADLVHDVVVEQVAHLLGVDPEVVEPDEGWD